MMPFIVLPALCTCLCTIVYAQNDSLVLKNKNVIVGEMKSMNNGVLTIETGYSKSDFTIEWDGIKAIYSKTNFLITLQSGARINGSIHTRDTTDKIVITGLTGETLETTLDDIVYLKGVKSKFWSRTYASVDLGLNLTKANNLRQLNVQSGIGYMGNKWQVDVFYNDLRSKQDSIAQTKRTESGFSLKYFLPKDWFLVVSMDFLSNTEQAIKLRTTAKTGVGNFIVHTNRSYWGLTGGFSFNNERFTNGTESRKSFEGFLGSELNLFDIGDLSLSNSVFGYPSFTEAGRWRVDFAFDSKYDLPLDLYVKLGLTFNYDNRPAAAGNELDYVLTFSIGWEFNK